MKKLSSRTKSELVVLANDFGIDTAGLKKAEIIEAIEAVGDGADLEQPEVKAAEPVAVAVPKEKAKKVPLVSNRDMRSSNYGTLKPGMNFVTKGAASWWLRHKPNGVRVAVPQEVQQFYAAMTSKD
jgi:hypothetical protein